MDVSGFSCPDFRVVSADEQLFVETARLRVRITLNGLRCVWEQRDESGWRVISVDRGTQAYDSVIGHAGRPMEDRGRRGIEVIL